MKPHFLIGTLSDGCTMDVRYTMMRPLMDVVAEGPWVGKGLRGRKKEYEYEDNEYSTAE